MAQTIYGHALLSASTVLCPSVFPSRGCSGIHHDLVLGISVRSLPHHYFHNRHGHWATIFRVHLSPDCSLRCIVILIEVSLCGGASRGETSLRTILEIKKSLRQLATHSSTDTWISIHPHTHSLTHTRWQLNAIPGHSSVITQPYTQTYHMHSQHSISQNTLRGWSPCQLYAPW